MARFTMTLDFDIHDHSPSAHRRHIEQMLAQVSLAIGRGVDSEGEIVTPAVGASPRAVIGEWKISGDD